MYCRHMRRLFILLACTTVLIACSSTKNFNIQDSKDIKEIENYIRKNPNDKNIAFLKQKLQALKNAQQPKKDNTELPPPIIVQTIAQQEAEEFEKLMQLNKETLSTKTVNVLNQLFNNDISNREAILLVKNNSDCNMIMRIQGAKFYNLAVPAHGENSMVIPQGEYKLSTNLCDLNYVATKNITKNMVVALRPNVPVRAGKAN